MIKAERKGNGTEVYTIGPGEDIMREYEAINVSLIKVMRHLNSDDAIEKALVRVIANAFAIADAQEKQENGKTE